jgi:hypothetical protein
LGISLPRCRHKILFTTKEIIHKRISFKELTQNARKMKEKGETFYQPKGGTKKGPLGVLCDQEWAAKPLNLMRTCKNQQAIAC